MSTKSLANPGQRCKLILQHCLAIQLCKPGHTPQDFWMYDSGYIVFQNFLAANEQCWWNAPLTAATRALKYAGHVAPGMLLVTADPCALEILRGAYARSVLKPPATYVISSLGDIDDCIVTPTLQGQFTPLPEAICNVIMDLTSEGQSATIENVRKKLATRFPHMSLPAIEIIYDTLAQLMQEQKIYQTSKGYFIFTPEKRRSRSRTRNINATYCDLTDCNDLRADMMMPTTTTNTTAVATSSNTPTSLLLSSSSSSSSYTRNIGAKRPILMTNVDAVRSMYGEISTERDGDLTHQCIQTNLTDVICGGNPNDKILYARVGKRRSASFPTPRSLERRHSLRLFGSSSKRLQRFSSTRSLSKTYVQSMTTDSSSSEFQSTDSSTRKKGSLLSRLFRRRTRPKHERLETFSAQFPPVEWFNSRTVHLHSVGTQTSDIDIPLTHTYSNSTFYTGSEVMSQRSASSTLPRRRQRHHLSSESTFLLSSRDCSPIRRRSPATFSSNSLPHHPMSKNNNNNNNHNSNVDTTNDNNNVKKNINSMTVTRNSNKVDGQNESKTANVQQITDFDCDETFFECRKKGGAHASSLDIQCATPVRSYLRSSLPIRHSAALRQAVNTERNESPSPSLSPSHGMSNTSSRHSSSTTVTGGGGQTPALRRSWRTQQMKRDGINLRESSAITLQVTSSAVQPPITTTICTPSPTTTTEWHVGNGNGAYNVKGPHNTKIYVQNTPLRNVITFENEQLLANSNVYIINNETLTNSTGDVLNKTLTTQMHKKPQPSKPQQKPTEVEEEAKASAISNENNLAKNSTTKVSPEEANMVDMVDEKPAQDDEYFENKSIEEFHKISFNLQPQQQQQQQQPAHHNKIVDNSDENNDDDNNDDDDDSYNVTTNHVVVKRAKSISYNNNNNYNNNNSNINHKTNNNSNNNNNKNNNITTLNNNRRLSMPQQSTLNAIGHYGSTHLIYKNNVRKNNDNNNINNHNNNNNNNQQQEQQFADFYVDNLGYYEKNNYKMLSNNALCEAKNLRNSNQYIYNNHHQQPQHINSNNNHNNTIFNNCHSSSNSMNAIGGIGGNSGGNNLAQLLLHKHMMESEPNLITLNETNNYFFSANPNANTNQLLTNKSSSTTTTTTTTATKDKIDNYSSVGTLTTLNDENRMSFPTLHDISFNFTSLAAQRILQAVSLNSIDTLVELNLDAAKKFNKQQVNQHQQQQQQQQHDNELNNPTTKNTQKTAAIATTTTKITAPQPALCTTDYGLV